MSINDQMILQIKLPLRILYFNQIKENTLLESLLMIMGIMDLAENFIFLEG
jgi:hypothetical protein